MVNNLLKHLFKRPATVKYPFEKKSLDKGYRGSPVWDMKKCTGCELCYKVCPSQAIEMFGRGLEATFKHYLDRCLFCGQCEESCPVNAITMTEKYELACYNRSELIKKIERET
ncbi:MAG: 4Fe-4S binding protein [Candidatus Hodarchaeota archaeon]